MESVTAARRDAAASVGFGNTHELSLYRKYGKRVFDVTVALLLLPIIALPILICALIVSTDGGRPFYAQQRVGVGGRLFSCFKIRSMAVDAEERLLKILETDEEAAAEWAESHKLLDDPRVTVIGKFLRKTSLDELPQIWNVLRGDMSLVGPRPVVPAELTRYTVHVDSYLRTRPGVTGAWQVSGRNDVTYDERVQMDVAYERNMRLTSDVGIILRTAKAVVNSTGY